MAISTLLDSMTSVLTAASANESASAAHSNPVNEIVSHRIPAGWYPDRERPTRRRWWNGTDWTDFYTASIAMPEPVTTSEPVAVSEPVAIIASVVTPTAETRQPVPSPRHSAATGPSPLPGLPTTTELGSTTRPIPAVIFVLLAGLTGANAVLLSLLLLAN
jgi:hypothetical protein